MNPDWTIVALSALGASIAMTVLWLVQRRTGDAGIADVGWALGVGALAVLYAWCGQGYGLRRLLVAAMGGIWALRLAVYLLRDRVFQGEEDGRYQMLRQNWGARAQFNFFWFLQVQAFFIVVFSLPFLVVVYRVDVGLDGWDWAAVTLWLLALVGESVADLHLRRFRADPANGGRICRTGLWRYSRHPNYFFEWLHWWAYVFLAVPAPHGWVALSAPLFLLYLLFYVTGIPYTEKRALASRGDDYRRYQRSTSAFIPWFPRKEET